MPLNPDAQWEAYGQCDPYYGVRTRDRFRSNRLDARSKEEFFDSGAQDVGDVMRIIRSSFDPEFQARRVLDFGCGVGRCTIPLARIADEVVALDISASMLREAEKNCLERSVNNVRFLKSDDRLSAVTGAFDIVHARRVFLHIPLARGRVIFSRMLDVLSEGGVIVVDFLYSRAEPAWMRALGELRKTIPPLHYVANRLHGRPWRDPLMEKNVYSLNEFVLTLYSRGCRELHVVTHQHGPLHYAMICAQKQPVGNQYDN